MNMIKEREEFRFNRDQLTRLFTGILADYEQRRHEPNTNEQQSRLHATSWMLHRLDADAEKAQRGLGAAEMQTIGNRLQEAAPEMRDALKNLLDQPLSRIVPEGNPVLDNDPITADWANAVEQGQAALDQAEGRTPEPTIEQPAQARNQQRQQPRRTMELSR